MFFRFSARDHVPVSFLNCMTDTPSITAVRLSAALVALAKAEGAAQNRSISGQVEHWARLGMALEAAPEARLAELSALLAEGQAVLEAQGSPKPKTSAPRRGFAAAARSGVRAKPAPRRKTPKR